MTEEIETNKDVDNKWWLRYLAGFTWGALAMEAAFILFYNPEIKIPAANKDYFNKTINQAYLQDVNKDGLQDIVSPSNKKIYLQQEDGKFIEFEEATKKSLDSLINYQQNIVNKRLDSLKSVYFPK